MFLINWSQNVHKVCEAEWVREIKCSTFYWIYSLEVPKHALQRIGKNEQTIFAIFITKNDSALVTNVICARKFP